MLPNREWTPPKIDFSKVDKLQEVKKANVYNCPSFVKRIERGAHRKVVNLEVCYCDHDELLRHIAILKSAVVFWRDKTKGQVQGHWLQLAKWLHLLANPFWGTLSSRTSEETASTTVVRELFCQEKRWGVIKLVRKFT